MAASYRQREALSDPGQDGFEITPADDDFSGNRVAVALWVGGNGTIRVTTIKGTVLNFANFQGWLPMTVRRVWTTGTTATSIVGVF